MGTNERDLQLDKPNPARIHDYLLGGKRNYAMDREVGRRILAMVPRAREICLDKRHWLARAVTFGIQQGIRQFLDVGSGMPLAGHPHDVAQSLAPESRVVYVDADPIAAAHSQIALEDNKGAVVINTEGRNPDAVIAHPDTRRMFNLAEPVMVLLTSLIHFIRDDEEAAKVVARYADFVAPGSYLALSAPTSESDAQGFQECIPLYAECTEPIYLRSRAQVRALLDGLELVEPGLVFTYEWRPENPAVAAGCADRSALLAAVARKP